ncbi:MAG: 2Fe-2S iron-sulfur cluster-binding protein, partial [Candidatus Bathyarchaeota archaeon]|nr:2Fe-2S iron-sulfur cluster-binding protein [Candidatus Bathyarchaeota archaeon]
MTEKKRESEGVSRREFLKDAGLLVGGTAVGSTVLLAACSGDTTTETVTSTKTVTAPGGATTVTQSKFVCPYCSTEFSSLSELTAHVTAEHAGESPSALNVINITVNGAVEAASVSRTETLRDVLREKFGLFSIKDMCSGYGACGSCSVIMDGRPVLSCMTLACECDGAVIETAEGVAESNAPLVDAYIVNQCMQCGYCTPGFIVTSKALLDRNPQPTEEDIREILAGNICRCGTYP